MRTRARTSLTLPRRRLEAVRWMPTCLLLLGLCHCQRQLGAELLQVDAVVPAEAQFGDSLHVVGDGFGLGNPATVTFRGDVYRAGRAPKAVDVSFRAQTESQRELTVALLRDAESAFCGEPEQASHATFRGDVSVAIASRAAGAPPVSGSLHGAVVELYPAVKTQLAQDQLSSLGRKALQFFGLEVAEARAGGLSVISVAPEGRAARADLRAGDRLVRAGGLSVLQPSDLVPEQARALELRVVRGTSEQNVLLEADGFLPLPPRDLLGPALLIAVVALWFIGLATPATRVLAWLVHNWAEQERSRSRALARGRAVSSRRTDGPSLIELIGGAAGALVWLGVGAALLAPLVRRAPVDVTLGLLALMFAAATLLGVFAFVEGGRGTRSWSFRRGIRAGFGQWLVSLPAWVALLAIFFESGIDFEEIVGAQGAAPWRWNAFENPGCFLLFGALLLTALPRPGKSNWRLLSARPPRVPWRGKGDGWLGWLYLCSTCAVATLAFLGGGGIGQAPGDGGASLIPSLPAALLLLAKYSALVLAVAFLRALSLGVTTEQWQRVSLRVCLPVSLAAALLAQGWRLLEALPPFWHWLSLGFGPASFGAVLLACAAAAWRASREARRAPPASLSTWL